MTFPLRAVPDAHVTVTDALEAYLASMADFPEKAGTHRQYGTTLRKLAREIGPDRDITSITQADLLAWMRETQGGNAPKTWNSVRGTLRAAWTWLAEKGYADATVPYGIPRRKVAQDWDRAIPAASLAALLDSEAIPLRERALWRLLYETAARISEILRLDVGELDQAGKRARVVRKGSAVNVVTWRTRGAAMLAAYLAGRSHGPLFTTEDGERRLSYRQAEILFTRHTQALPGGPYTLHQLRHSALHQASNEGASTAQLLAYSGHAGVDQNVRYSRLSGDELAAWQERRDPDRDDGADRAAESAVQRQPQCRGIHDRERCNERPGAEQERNPRRRR